MNLVSTIIALLFAFSATSHNLYQRTEGWCSPAVADVRGNVHVVCQGVDPRALDRLNELLDLKDLKLAEKIEEADNWASKYNKLKSRLEFLVGDPNLTQQARRLINQGEFEKAGELLDQLISEQDLQLSRLAENHFIRAELYDLQLKQHLAITHYQKAYYYKSDNKSYAYEYARSLINSSRIEEAKIVISKLLDDLHVKALQNENDFNDNMNLADGLKLSGFLKEKTLQPMDSERSYLEAMKIYGKLSNLVCSSRETECVLVSTQMASMGIILGKLYIDNNNNLELADNFLNLSVRSYSVLSKVSPSLFQPKLALAYEILGKLYRSNRKIENAILAEAHVLKINRNLATTNPEAYLPGLARYLGALGLVYFDAGQVAKAEETIKEAISLHRGLATKDPNRLNAGLASSLEVLAILYYKTGRLELALEHCKQQISLSRKLAVQNPEKYESILAHSLMNLGKFYARAKMWDEAIATYEEALQISRRLLPKGIRDDKARVAEALDRLGELNLKVENRYNDAMEAMHEAPSVYQQLAKEEFTVYGPLLAMALIKQSTAYDFSQRRLESIKAREQALTVYRKLSEINPKYRSGIAWVQTDLAIRYYAVQRSNDCEAALIEAVDVYKDIVKDNPSGIVPSLKKALTLLGGFYTETNRLDKAVQIYAQLEKLEQDY